MSRRRPSWAVLPIGPLVDEVERRRRASGASWTALCRSAGVCRRSMARWLARGDLPAAAADRLAVALGLHPVMLWPNEWPAALDAVWPLEPRPTTRAA